MMYEDMDSKAESEQVQKSHFDLALNSLVRSIGTEQLDYFENFRLHSGVKAI